MFDVIVAGGSYAGLSAALQLARARRKVAVIDAGKRRNRFATTSHGFLTRDGHSAEAIAREAREQLLVYPTVTWIDGTATQADGSANAFTVDLDDGRRIDGRRLILATGLVDILPHIPGLAEQWGTSVFHCPYCHGYELDQGRIGVLATGPHSMHQALMLPDWGATTFFTNGAVSPDDKEQAELSARSVAIEATPVEAVEGAGDGLSLRLADGREVELDGLFTAPRHKQASPLAEQLGCAFEEGPLGSTIEVDAMKATSVDGVYACGDAARPAGSVTLAVSDGALAGISAHRSLMFGLER